MTGRSTLTLCSVALIFLGFMVFLLAQYRSVFPFFDDFGYASLTYAVKVDNASGTDFNMAQLWRYAMGHYREWGGRILYNVFYTALCFKAGLWFYRLLTPVLIAAMFAFLYAEIMRGHDADARASWVAAFVCALYGLFARGMLTGGIYWASALAYSLPFTFAFAAIWLTRRLGERHARGRAWYGLLFALWFVAAFSQEQVAVMLLCYAVIMLVHNRLRDGRVSAADAVTLAAVALGAALVLLAPGNFSRMDKSESAYATSMLGLLRHNAVASMAELLGTGSEALVIAWSSLAAVASALLLREPRRIWKALGWAGLAVCGLSAVLNAGCVAVFGQTLFVRGAGYLANGLFAALTALASCVALAGYLAAKRRPVALTLYVGGIASLAPALVAPYVVGRMMIPFVMAQFVAMASVFADMTRPGKGRRAGAAAAFLLVAALSIHSSVGIYRGYRANAPVHIANDARLRAAATEIAQGREVDYVLLDAIPDETYTPGFPDFTAWFLRSYYALPRSLPVLYERWAIDRERMDTLLDKQFQSKDPRLDEYLTKVIVK